MATAALQSSARAADHRGEVPLDPTTRPARTARRRAAIAALATSALATLGAAPALALSPPTVSGGADAWTNAVTVTVSASGGGVDAVDWEYETSVDQGGSWSAAASGTSVPVSAAGETWVRFRSVDAGSATSAWAGAPSASGIVKIDRFTPSTPGRPTAATPTNGDPALAWAASTDSGGSGLTDYRVLRDGSAVGTPGSAVFIDAGAPEGTLTYTVQARDGAGNTSLASPSRVVVHDLTPPAAPAVAGGSAQVVNRTVTVSASGGSDALSGLAGYEHRASADGGATWSAPAPGADLAVDAEGETLVQFRSVDAAGNRGAWVPSHASGPDPSATARIDRTPPAAPGSLAGSGSPLTATWAAAADAVSYRLLRDGAEIASTAATTAVDAGALDLAPPDPVRGVAAAVPRRGEVVLRWPAAADRGTGRAYRLESLDAAGNAAGTEAVLAAQAGGVRYRVALDGVPATTVTAAAARLRGLDPARAREVTVTAIDAAGNAAAPSAALSVVPAPGPAPRLRLDVRRGAVRPGVPLDVRAVVSGPAADAVEWRLDGAVVAEGPRLSLAVTAVGRHTVLATVHGRTGTPVRASATVWVDETAPDLTLLLERSSLRAVARDAGSGVDSVRMVHGPGQPADLSHGRAVPLPDGIHRIVVRGIDRAGNRSDIDQKVVSDGTPPSLRVTVPGVTSRGRIEARIDVSDRVSGIRRVSLDGRDLDEGVLDVRLGTNRPHVIVAEDNMGNSATVLLRVAYVPRLPRTARGLDGARGDQIRWDGGRRVTGVRARILRGVQAQLMATGDLPADWVVGDRYTLPLLRVVQAFQRRTGLPANGTIGPRTRAALERATRPSRTVVGR